MALDFEQFFDVPTLEEQFGKKVNFTDLELKANKTDLKQVEQEIDMFNEKLRHVTVFLEELSGILLTKKHISKNVNEDLNEQLAKRRKLIEHSKNINRWIFDRSNFDKNVSKAG